MLRSRGGCAPAEAEVLVVVVVHEVAIACHPHVARDEHADGVVDLARVEVVVQQEEHLRAPRRHVSACDAMICSQILSHRHAALQGSAQLRYIA